MLKQYKPTLDKLTKIVGKSHVLIDEQDTRHYRQGMRFGEGKVLAVVCPGTLLEQWQALQTIIEADCVVIMQAANTGLTGSSCIGASVLGGVCNNSGGALVRRGPAYTEMALYARVNESGELELINHLGIDLGNTAEEILTRLQKMWVIYMLLSQH